MKKLCNYLTLFLFVFLWSAYSAGATEYILTDFPITLLSQDTAVWIKWTGVNRDPSATYPDSGKIYYSLTPGGGVISNYTDSITKRVSEDTLVSDQDTIPLYQNNILDTSQTPYQRGIKFSPEENGMGAGVYYAMVGYHVVDTINSIPIDTFFTSNEVQIIVEASSATKPLSPENGDTIAELTPTFQWENNPGVPYYHVIVSDEKISPNLDSGTVEGLSVIWEAITSNTQIVYGAPDPSGTLVTDPPPMSPGKEYSWVVLNNYGNHPAYSSTRFSLPYTFTIEGDPLKAPVNLSPVDGDSTLNSLTDANIELKWTNLDSLANTYKVYVYVSSDISGVDAQVVVWSTEVTAGQFTGDTGSVTFNAASILTTNRYTWKVMAVDSKGAGTSGSITSFKYSTTTGFLKVHTKEKIVSGSSEITKNVALAEIDLEVLGGSLEPTLLYYTDNNGYFGRNRPAGSYRLTIKKNGFSEQTKTITISDNDTTDLTFYMERPDATIYGAIKDNSGMGIDLATVMAVSDLGDTISAETDPYGSYVLNCYAADWTLWAQKTGYATSEIYDTTVTTGGSFDMGDLLVLTKNPYTLYGTVKNSSNQTLLGVSVKLYKDGTKISEVPSTAEDGGFSFSVTSGTYKLTATKTGFTSFSDTIDVLSSTNKTIVMSSGAALLSGAIIGKSWNEDSAVFAPVTNAKLMVIDTVTFDTLEFKTDATYGTFSASVEGGKAYKLVSELDGYYSSELITDSLAPGKTYTLYDTVVSYAILKGKVTSEGDSSGVTVSLLDTSDYSVVATATTDAVGEFEMHKIPNSGSDAFRITVGKAGYILDTLKITDINSITTVSSMVYVADGKVKNSLNNSTVKSVAASIVAGSKNLLWFINNGKSLVSANVKLKSPLQSTIASTDTMKNIGPDKYVSVVDATTDSIIDCSYHTYDLPYGSDSTYIDTLLLPLFHKSSDTISLLKDTATMTVSSYVTIDSGYIFYKDKDESSYKSAGISSVVTDSLVRYLFSFIPTKSGGTMNYYFKFYSDGNVYGYSDEFYSVYVKPDSTVLTKFGIEPTASDTFQFAAGDEVTFKFNGYYGSNFTKAEGLSESNVVWEFVSGKEFGSSVSQSGLVGILKTSESGSQDSISVLTARFVDGGGFTHSSTTDTVVKICFKVTSSKLDSVYVKRNDEDGRGYITTSSLEKAEFSAVGIDENGNKVDVTPVWNIAPENAGVMTDGIFRPADNFFGRVDIRASVGKNVSSFYLKDGSKGLPVYYLLASVADTVGSGLGVWGDGHGCSIVFPDSVVGGGGNPTLSLNNSILLNNIYHSTTISVDSTDTTKLHGRFDLVGEVYDITDRDSAVDFSRIVQDSIILTLGIPKELWNDAASNRGTFFIAYWLDSLKQWEPQENSVVATDGRSVSVALKHFSKYAVIKQPRSTQAEFSIYPNPFSPRIIPRARDGENARAGTCFKITASSSNSPSVTISVDVYNMRGEVVWSVVLQNARSSQEYNIWWDGKTITNKKSLGIEHEISEGYYAIDGNLMCRNGRYFAIVTVDDGTDKKQYVKNVVLFK